MATSAVSIVNMAIIRCGSTQTITDLAEDSPQAIAANQFFEPNRDFVLRDFPWPFAKKYATLALVAEDPNCEWGYSYRYPTDCIRVRYLPYGTDRRPRVPIEYTIGKDATGKIILTDQVDAEIVYTEKITDYELFDADFVSMFSWRMAMDIAPYVTKGDPFGFAKRASLMYLTEKTIAESNASNEEQELHQDDAEWIDARG